MSTITVQEVTQTLSVISEPITLTVLQGPVIVGGASTGAVRYVRTITIKSGQNLNANSVLGKNVSNKYVLSTSAASDGSAAPSAVLVAACNASAGDTPAAAYMSGEFNAGDLVLGVGHTVRSIIYPLRANGIFTIGDWTAPATVGLLDSVLALATPVYAWAGGNAWQDVAGTVASSSGDLVRNLPDARGSGPTLTGASGTAVLETVGGKLCLRTTAGGAGLAAAFTYALPVTIAMVIDVENAASGASDIMIDGNTIISLTFGSTGAPNSANGASSEGFYSDAAGVNRAHTAELVRKWAVVIVEVSGTQFKVWQNGRIIYEKSTASTLALGGLTLGGLGGANGRGADARYGLLAAYSGALISSNFSGVATLGAILVQSFGVTARSSSTEIVTVFVGDSITAGYGISRNSAWPEQFAALKGGQWTARNTGIPNRTAQELASDMAVLAGQYIAFSTRAVVLAGTNDILQGASGATTATRVKALWTDLIGRGYSVYAATIPALADYAGTPGGGEPARVAANAEIVSSWAGLGCTGLINLAADSRLSNGNDAAYFQSDKLHPSIAGAGVIAELVAAVVT